MAEERNEGMDRARAQTLDTNRKWAQQFGGPETQERHEAAYQRHVERVGYDPLDEQDEQPDELRS